MENVSGSARIRLIPLTEDHVEDLFAIYSDAEVMRFYDSHPHTERSQTERLLELLQERERNGVGFRRGILFEGGSRVVGTIGFNTWTKERSADVGYDLSRDHWRRGIMSEALAAVVHHGFERLGVHRIQAEVVPGNEASERLLAQSGFVREGLLRDKYFFKGAYQSMVVYSRLRTDT